MLGHLIALCLDERCAVLGFVRCRLRVKLSVQLSAKGRANMANVSTKKGIIGILTGGGDVPGLNPAIRGVTYRALREGYQVIGFRHGWGGLIDIVRDKDYDNSNNYQMLTEDVVNRASRTG